jgi:hypothetical protein
MDHFTTYARIIINFGFILSRITSSKFRAAPCIGLIYLVCFSYLLHIVNFLSSFHPHEIRGVLPTTRAAGVPAWSP